MNKIKSYNTTFRLWQPLLNNRGISLIEVIVSVVIMGIVTGPFLGTIIMSTRNNAYSGNVLKATELAQRVMEEIKSKPEFLEEQAVYQSEVQSTDYNEYLEENGYIVKYKIVKHENEISPLSDTYEFDEAMTEGDLNFYVDSRSVKFNGMVYNDFEEVQYCLKLKETSGTKSYELYKCINNDDDGIIQASGIISVLEQQPIKINIWYLNDCSQYFKLNVDVDELSDGSEAFFTIVDDKYHSLELCNIGDGTFYQFDEVSSGYEEYYNVLFEIELVVEYEQEQLNSMISYVKKNR